MSATDLHSIGTLNEGSLHHALKRRYVSRGARLEVAVEGYVADIVDGDRIIEVQTSGFSSLKRKLPALLKGHRVTLVHPIAATRFIVKVSEEGVTRRRSPKHGSLFDVFSELVAIPALLENPNLEIDVVLTEEEEIRACDGRRGRRRKGWIVAGRRLIDVVETATLRSLHDLFDRFEAALPEEFTTRHLGDAMARPRAVGQQAAYCLRSAGLLEVCGKQGNSIVYRRQS